MSFIWAHPYISACVIVGMFVAGIVRWVVRFFASQNKAEEEENFKTTILNLNARLRRMEERQEETLNLTARLQGMEERQEETLNARLQGMEERQEEILNARLQGMEERQEEILKLLRDSMGES